jgi:Tol biopolymer transport system component
MECSRVSGSSQPASRRSTRRRPRGRAAGVAQLAIAGCAFGGLASTGRAAVAHEQVACGLARISLDQQGQQPNLPSQASAISANGRFVAFSSHAPLVPSDVGVLSDVYLLDRATGALELISVGTSGGGGNLDSPVMPIGIHSWIDLSDDGRRVAWISEATNLAPGAGYVGFKAFVRDRATGQTQLVSTSTMRPQGEALTVALSGDGRFVAFAGGTPLLANSSPFGDVYVRDLQTGALENVSVAWNGQASALGGSSSSWVSLSFDGRYVTFESRANDHLGPPGTPQNQFQVYRRDRLLGLTELVSATSSGTPGDSDSMRAHCSSDGRIVVFRSAAANLGPHSPWLDVFVRDLGTGTISCVTPTGADGNSDAPRISPDGAFIAYASLASNLVLGDSNNATDVFLFERFLTIPTTRRVSKGLQGASNGHSYQIDLANGARSIVFDSYASDLVHGDTNQQRDVFLEDCGGVAWSYCTGSTNSLGCVPRIDWQGVPRVSWPQGFRVTASEVRNQVAGTLVYGTTGPAASPFHGGTLCVAQPLRRTPPQSSQGSTSGADCSGTFSFDVLAWVASGSDPALVAGQRVWAQYWSRDSGFAPPLNVSTTDAVSFELLP